MAKMRDARLPGLLGLPALACTLALAGTLLTATGSPSPAGAADVAEAGVGRSLPRSLWFDEQAAADFTVKDGRFTDGLGREVVLRGYNVSGETKLAENDGLPFASVADAEKSASAMRVLGGANTARFLLSWAYAEPVRGQVDEQYSPPSPASCGRSCGRASASTRTSTRICTPATSSTRAAGTRATARLVGPWRPGDTRVNSAASASSGARTSPRTRP
jgi:hypothetical protein